MQKAKLIGILFVLGGVALTQSAWAHCEIPCGIYDDEARIGMLREHTRTLEKSMNEIKTLQQQEEQNYNQLVRWINNKEEHADKVQDIVYQYFMNQRITPVTDPEAEGYQTYIEQITLLHRMLTEAMKCKQTLDKSHIENLRDLIDAFEESYFSQDEEHGHSH